jgi:hypothetical protein
MKTQTISIPIHPEDSFEPVSLVHIKLSPGRYATICGPLGRKTLMALQATINGCADAMMAPQPDPSDEYHI